MFYFSSSASTHRQGLFARGTDGEVSVARYKAIWRHNMEGSGVARVRGCGLLERSMRLGLTVWQKVKFSHTVAML